MVPQTGSTRRDIKPMVPERAGHGGDRERGRESRARARRSAAQRSPRNAPATMTRCSRPALPLMRPQPARAATVAPAPFPPPLPHFKTFLPNHLFLFLFFLFFFFLFFCVSNTLSSTCVLSKSTMHASKSIPTRLAKCGGFGACKLQRHLVCQAGGMRSLSHGLLRSHYHRAGR